MMGRKHHGLDMDAEAVVPEPVCQAGVVSQPAMAA